MWNKQGNIFNKHHAQVPVVDVYDSFFRIYYSTRIDGKSRPMFIDVDKHNPKNVLSFPQKVSLDLGKPGSFDWAGVMPTDIITVDNIKYLYYIGWSLRQDVPYHNSLGLALSKDNGKTWEKYSKGPIFSTSYKEPGYIGTIDVLKENKSFKGYYLSCQEWIQDKVMEPIYDIKLATSKNGIDWEPTGKICIPLQQNEGGISAARVVKIKNTYNMWFSVRDKTNYRTDFDNSYRIKLATSKDGISWIRHSHNEIDISKKPWEDIMVCYPEVIKQDNKLHMFYNGNGFGKTGIGYAYRTA
tara:strand:- start:260 stop:1153 length:894 start_codon:yes stop_codon:yes gene_type:complete